jgi:hypothetical protein
MPLTTAMTGSMQLAKLPLQRLDFAFVIDLLALGHLECFQHHLHFLQRLFQVFDDVSDLLDGAADACSDAWMFRFRS